MRLVNLVVVLLIDVQVFSIECGDKPVDNVGFFVRTKKGDVVIGAPSGRVRIYGKTVDIVASGSIVKLAM